MLLAERYSESCQTSNMELFVKIASCFQPLIIFAKSSNLDVWHVSDNAFVKCTSPASLVGNVM